MGRSRLVETNVPRLLTQAEVVAWIRGRSPAELAAFIAALEERLLVAPPYPPPMGTSNPPWIFDDGATSNPPDPSVVLLDPGPNRIPVLKAIRARRGLSLRDSLALVDNPPVIVLEQAWREDAEALLAELTALGARAELRWEG